MDLFLKYGIQASVVPPVSGYLELLHDSGTITSATTSYTIPNLSISKTDDIVLIYNIANTNGAVTEYYSYVNGNTTNSNYIRQVYYGISTTVGGARVSNPNIGYNYQNTFLTGKANIKLTNNNYSTLQSFSSNGPLFSETYVNYLSSTFTMTTITSLSISSSVANGIGFGSRFQLYRVKD